jgi:hypothetical protein
MPAISTTSRSHCILGFPEASHRRASWLFPVQIQDDLSYRASPTTISGLDQQ